MLKKFPVSILPFLFILFPILPQITNAWMQIPSIEITEDTTWTIVNSPYYFTEMINIHPGVTLTIEPGVIVKLEYATINVDGQLIANGSQDNLIIFTSNSGGQQEWTMMVWPGGKVNLNYVTIQRGGYYETYDEVDYYTGAIAINGGEVNINNSTILNNRAAISNQSEEAQINIHNSTIDNNYLVAIVNYAQNQINATDNWWGDATGPYHQTLNPQGQGDRIIGNVLFDPWIGKQQKKTPVIIVPGIMGSWYSAEKGWQLDPILHTYDNLYKALVENGGYVPEETLFTFPYEWRQENAITAYQLKQKIDNIKNQTGAGKVDIIAHSMGGLVARYYIESDYYANDVDRVIFLGTPHKGSPEAYLRWEGATGFENIDGLLTKLYFTLEAHARGYETLFNYIQESVPSVEQLLPIYPYLQNIEETSFREYDQENYPNNYPYNEFLEDLNSAVNLDKFTNSGVKIFNITGNTGDDTINALKISSGEPYWPMWQHGYTEETIKLTGDGTVPSISSSLFIPTEIAGVDHISLPTKAQKQIIDYLTGEMPINEITVYPEPKEVLVVSVFSPVDFIIISPSGKKLGKDFSTSSEINEMENGFYSGFSGETEFAVIVNPEEGEYKIELEGTGDGDYKINANYFDNNNEIEKTFSGSIQNGEIHNFNINYSGEEEEPISELIPLDNTPPSILIITPEENSQYLHNGVLDVDYEATDDLSGVENIILKLDDQETSTTSLDLFYYDLGEHILEISASDKAGNIASTSVKFKITANIESAIADIGRAYKLGFISKEFVKNILITEMKIIQNRLELFEKEKEILEKAKEKIINNAHLNSEIKEKLLKNINEKLESISQRKHKFVNVSLDGFIKTLNLFNKLGFISQQGYAIILNNANYLKINL